MPRQGLYPGEWPVGSTNCWDRQEVGEATDDLGMRREGTGKKSENEAEDMEERTKDMAQDAREEASGTAAITSAPRAEGP